jgi:hypothetical protein
MSLRIDSQADIGTSAISDMSKTPMMKPKLFDVVEMLVNLPELGLQVGDRGAIVEEYSDRAYEIEFIVVWVAKG